MALPGVNRKRKGTRVERELVKELEALGLNARRQYASGAFGTRIGEARFQGDVAFKLGDEWLKVECKARANGEGFTQLERWQAGCDVLLVKRDRQAPQVVITFDVFKRLLDLANRGGEQ